SAAALLNLPHSSDCLNQSPFLPCPIPNAFFIHIASLLRLQRPPLQPLWAPRVASSTSGFGSTLYALCSPCTLRSLCKFFSLQLPRAGLFVSGTNNCKLIVDNCLYGLVRTQNPPLRAPPLDHRRQSPRPALPLGPRAHRRLFR